MPKPGNRRLSLPEGEETALPDWVDDQKWAWAPEGRVRLPDGELDVDLPETLQKAYEPLGSGRP